MKLRTVLISVVVSAALVGGAGYGAYYATQSRKSPIEVVPVANVSMGYWGMEDQQIVYGSVTSQVSQTVQLDEEYGIDKIYVQVGDEVKEGTPLFSYDMTLQELELEMQQLELQTNELTMTRLEKELDKLKRTPATASLERDRLTLTASAEEGTEVPVEPKETEKPEETEMPEETEAPEEPKDADAPDEIIPDEPKDDDPYAAFDEQDADGKTDDAQGGVQIDDVEKIDGGAESTSLSTVEDSILSFEALVLELQATFLTCGEDLKADDVGEAIEQAVLYYRKNLADEETTEEEQEDGSVKEIHSYALKDSVKAVLDKEETETLRKRSRTLDEYQVRYVEMLITEAEELEGSALVDAVDWIADAYELLATRQREEVQNTDRFEELKSLADAARGEMDESGDALQSQGDGSRTDGEQPEDVLTETDGAGQDEQTTDGTDGVGQDEQTTDGTDGAGQDTQTSGEENSGDAMPPEPGDADGVRRNTVTFDVSEGAAAAVNGQDVTNSFAMAEDGRIVFVLIPEVGYRITEVLVDGSIPARKNESSDDPDDYIIEGIQTNDTIVSVRTQQDGSAPAATADEEGTGGESQGSGTEKTGGENQNSGTEETGGENQNSGTEETGGESQGSGTEETGGENQNSGTEETGGENQNSGTQETSGESQGSGTQETGGESQNSGTQETSGESQATEAPDKKEYTVTINPGNRTEMHEVGRLVPLQADLSDVTLVFMGWSVAPTSEAAAQTEAAAGETAQTDTAAAAADGQTQEASGDAGHTVALNAEDVANGYASFIMPEFDVTATARYENAPDAIESYVATFLADAEKLLAENARQTYLEQGRDFLTELESAIVFYQQWLSDPMEEILAESETAVPDMEDYQLLSNVNSYLTESGREFQVTQLQEHYRDLCLLYAKSLFEAIDSVAIDKTLLEKALDTYARLGESWRETLEAQWKEEQANLAEQNGQPWKKNKKGKLIAPDGFLGIGDTLEAYAVLQMFQELLSLPPDTPEEDRYDMVLDIWSRYLDLSDAQRLLVNSDPFFAEMFKQYGLWEDEPETEFPDDFGDDFGGFGGDEPMYTAEELAEMIRDKEQEIQACSLDIRQSELDVKQKQRVVDGKVVKSTMDGTVVSIGDADGNSDEDYFVKVANEAGLYAKGTMSELTLEKINVGDSISGMLTMNGTSFNAVIKEVSEYPDSNGQYMSYGQENTNASYYSFYALIEDTEGLEEGEAEIYLSGTAPGDTNAIYLDNYFVRTESDGRTYVYKKGDDGKLAKQYVKTGRNTGYSLEIKEGLSFEDSIAFPYGKDVKEGAKTKDVDALQDAYM